MSTATKKKLLTAEEFMLLPDPPDGAQQELDRGEVVTMPSPKARHGICCIKVGRKIGDFVEKKKLGHVASSDSGVILERNPDTVRGPDIAYYSFKRVPKVPEAYFEVAPDLVVEVVSPDDSFSKLQRKVRQYLASGTPLVWIVDPELRTVTLHRSSERAQTLEEGETVTGEKVLPGFSCRVAEFFA